MEIIETSACFTPLVALAFMTLDVASGFLKALAKKEVSSQVMRQGFYHKAGLLLVMLVGGLLDYAISHIEALPYSVPVLEGASVYIIVMEITSILENVTEVTPQLKESKLAELFKPTSEK